MEQSHYDSEEKLVNIKVYNELGNPTPGIVNWLCSFIILGLMIQTMLWESAGVTGLRYARLQQEFSVEAGPRVDLEKLIESKKFKPLFQFHRDTIRRIRPVFQMIANNDLASASEWLDRTDAPHHPVLIAMSARLRQIVKDDALMKKMTNEERFFTERQPALWARYSDIRAELSKILQNESGSADDHQLTVYLSGILKGLPVVNGVPDNIQSIEVLAQFRHPAAGTPSMAPAMFLRKLRDIQATNAALAEENTQLQNQARTRLGAKDSFQKQQKRVGREANILLRRLMNDLARQTFPVAVRLAYDSLTPYLEKLKIAAPELRIDEKERELSDDEVEALIAEPEED